MSQVISLFDNQPSDRLMRMINCIQNLALRISCQHEFSVRVNYLGDVHWISVEVKRRKEPHQMPMRPVLKCHINLREKGAFDNLKNVAVCLESLLEPTPDDAA